MIDRPRQRQQPTSVPVPSSSATDSPDDLQVFGEAVSSLALGEQVEGEG